MAPGTMKDDALPQIHLVRDTDLGIFAYELHKMSVSGLFAKTYATAEYSVYSSTIG